MNGRCELAVLNPKPTLTAYTLLDDLLTEIPTIPKDGILSRTVFRAKGLKAVLFAFDAGQELSEHTSTYGAVIHILQGEATLTLGDAVHEAHPHTWVYMQPNLPHSIVAKTPLILLLLMQGGQ